MKASKIASIVYYTLLAISAVVLVLFFCVGFGNQESLPSGLYKSPQFTDLLMYWMYALMGVGIVCVAVFGLMQFGANMMANPKGAIKSIGALLAMIVLFVGAYLVSSAEPILINGTVFEDSTILLVTDVCIYVQYVLLGVSLIAAILSLLGVFKGFNKIKA